MNAITLKKGGRKREQGERYASGRLKPRDIGPTPELIARRAEIVPLYHAKQQAAGQALGMLYLRADITWAMWQAGESLRQSWYRWRSLQGIPPRTQTTRGKGSDYDPEWEQLDKARAEYEEKMHVCIKATKHSALTRATIECLCFEDIVPPRVYEIGSVPSLIRECIVKALGDLAAHLHIEDRK